MDALTDPITEHSIDIASASHDDVIAAIRSDEAHAADARNAVGEASAVSPEAAAAIATIVDKWRTRQALHRAEKALILQGKALSRSLQRAKSKEEAASAFDNFLAGKEPTGDIETDLMLLPAFAPFSASIAHFRDVRKTVEKEMVKAVRKAPAYDWVKSVRGFGELNYVAIIGETCGSMQGDLSTYNSVAALWKRMGLAVIDGGRQRRVSNAEEALVHGYNPSRRAVAYLLGDCLIRAGSPYSLFHQPKIVEVPKVVVSEKVVTIDRPVVVEKIIEHVIEKPVAAPTPASSLAPPLQLPGAVQPIDALKAKTAAEFTSSQDFKTAELHGTIVSFIGGRLLFDTGQAFVPTPDNPERKTTTEFNGLPGFCKENPIGTNRYDCFAFKGGSAVHI